MIGSFTKSYLVSAIRDLALTPSTAWVTLITNTQYLPGLLVLEYYLRRVRSRYPLVALFTDSFPEEGHYALNRRGIPAQRSKLSVFSLTQYDRLILLDADMLVVKNMDELMDLDLGTRFVFAASHACLCNPLKKLHYPLDLVPETARIRSSILTARRRKYVASLPQALGEEGRTSSYDFSDQVLLGDAFAGRWMALPYVYNGLKTLRWPGVHDAIWLDDRVKNLHYGLTPKPWQVNR
ncbi:glycosyl transferase [Cladorrhinum sp. PSN259]|nr:glycosyl transferase [Cladorrhinum sp. PSN259]